MEYERMLRVELCKLLSSVQVCLSWDWWTSYYTHKPTKLIEQKIELCKSGFKDMLDQLKPFKIH